jgi:hypothetical protein
MVAGPFGAEGAGVHFVSYSVETRAGQELAWEVFADWTRWRAYCDWIGEIRWTSGEPWVQGSRMEIDMVRPIHAHVSRVLQVCVPAKRLAWIDHVLGTTFEQWIFFEPLADGGTRVHSWAEFTGILSVVAGRPLKRVVQEFFQTWYDNFAAECDRRAGEATAARH